MQWNLWLLRTTLSATLCGRLEYGLLQTIRLSCSKLIHNRGKLEKHSCRVQTFISTHDEFYTCSSTHVVYIGTVMSSSVACRIIDISWKCEQNLYLTFWVILLKERQTETRCHITSPEVNVTCRNLLRSFLISSVSDLGWSSWGQPWIKPRRASRTFKCFLGKGRTTGENMLDMCFRYGFFLTWKCRSKTRRINTKGARGGAVFVPESNISKDTLPLQGPSG